MKIDIKLDRNFTTMFNQMKTDYGEELASLNGLSDAQLSLTEFIDAFVDKQVVADVSIDGNANVGHKDIVSLENEMNKPHSKLLAFNKIYMEIYKKYGYADANKWLKGEWLGEFYIHDASSSSYRPYCFAYDITELVNKGLFFIDNFNAQPPQHLETYVDFVVEFVSWTCNRSSGAVGLPQYLVYAYYFWKKDCEDGYFIKTPNYYRDQEFQRVIYKLNQPYVRNGIQSAFTNFSIFDESYLESLFGSKQFPDGSYIIDYIDDIIQFQKDFMNVVSKVRSQNMMTFPVLTYALLRQDGKFVNEDTARWFCTHNMKWADSNFFISDSVNSLSNCCRLKSNVEDLGYFNSIGGTALEVGSVKVNTINLSRISYECDSKEGYLFILKERVITCCKCLDIIRHIIKRNAEKGLLPNYTNGIINMSSQYNTIGIIGIYEALTKFGFTTKDEFGYTKYTTEGIEFAKDILETITLTKQEFAADKDYMINIEQIPGERAAYILMKKDKFFFPNERYELPLYGNQWIPLGVKTTLKDKIDVSAELDMACSGGSIAHINLDAPLNDSEIAWGLLNYVADKGVEYFAFNTKICACKNNHGFYGDVCPICGEPKFTTYQRIVGFLTPESRYSKERSDEAKLRNYFIGKDWDDLLDVYDI